MRRVRSEGLGARRRARVLPHVADVVDRGRAPHEHIVASWLDEATLAHPLDVTEAAGEERRDARLGQSRRGSAGLGGGGGGGRRAETSGLGLALLVLDRLDEGALLSGREKVDDVGLGLAHRLDASEASDPLPLSISLLSTMPGYTSAPSAGSERHSPVTPPHRCRYTAGRELLRSHRLVSGMLQRRQRELCEKGKTLTKSSCLTAEME